MLAKIIKMKQKNKLFVFFKNRQTATTKNIPY